MSTKSRKRKQILNKKKKFKVEYGFLSGLGFVEHLRISLKPKQKKSTIRGRMLNDGLKVYASDLLCDIRIPLKSEHDV